MKEYKQGHITVYAESYEEAMQMIENINEIERDFYLYESEEF